VLDTWRAAGRHGERVRTQWEARLKKSTARPEFERRMAGRLPEGCAVAIQQIKQRFVSEPPKIATRQASGDVLDVLMPVMPELLGGSADLTGSVNTKAKTAELLTPKTYAGRYVHYGVREFGMAAAMNGLALHKGMIPFGGTFLVFADYMRPAIRLSALMGQRVIYVLTHDSIGLGEDGPTHQPVETLASLRAIPNLVVLRPADPVETAEAWEIALKRSDGPTAISLTRQAVPALRTTHTSENLSARGGYVVAEADGPRRATVIATGSEVGVAMAAREQLQTDGVATAVVSLPSWELFDAQEKAYRDQVLGTGTVRVGVEAAVAMGWEKYLGPDGGFVGMSGFGASAPAPALFKHFGITAEAVAAAVKARL
jgi:transketolase